MDPATPERPVGEDIPSVLSMSSKVPKHRNALIIGGTLLFLIVLFSGGYFLLRGIHISVGEFSRNPIHYLSNLFMGPEAYEVCAAFLRQNERKFSRFGRIEELSVLKTEVRSLNKRETAMVTVRVVGSKETRDVHFQLQKRNNTWSILSVVLDLGNGRFKMIYPEPRPKPSRT